MRWIVKTCYNFLIVTTVQERLIHECRWSFYSYYNVPYSLLSFTPFQKGPLSSSPFLVSWNGVSPRITYFANLSASSCRFVLPQRLFSLYVVVLLDGAEKSGKMDRPLLSRWSINIFPWVLTACPTLWRRRRRKGIRASLFLACLSPSGR